MIILKTNQASVSHHLSIEFFPKKIKTMPSTLFVSNVIFMLERGCTFYYAPLYPCLCDKQLQTSACSVYTISIVSYLSNNNNDLLLCGARIFKSLTARNMSAITGKIVSFFVLFLLNDLDLIRTGTHYVPVIARR